jgi:hypothetical protein
MQNFRSQELKTFKPLLSRKRTCFASETYLELQLLKSVPLDQLLASASQDLWRYWIWKAMDQKRNQYVPGE